METRPRWPYCPPRNEEGVERPPNLADAVRSFWRDHLRATANTNAERWDATLGLRRAARARLRRCADDLEALQEAATFSLIRAVEEVKAHHPSLQRPDEAQLISLARTLAWVDEDDRGQTVPRALAQSSKKSSERARFSELRFRRLLQTETRDDFCRELRRALQMLEGKANVLSIAEAVCEWEHLQHGPDLRRRWAYDYFANAPDKKRKQADA